MSALNEEMMLELMAYADGELEGADKEKIEKLLSTNEVALQFVEQIGGLGDFAKMIHSTRDAKTVEKFDVADQVMAKLDKPEPKVVGLEAARAKRKSKVVPIAGVITALALAASVFFFARPKETPMSQGPVAVQQQQESIGVEVEQTGADVKVFYMPGANEVTTSVVVWVDEEAK